MEYHKILTLENLKGTLLVDGIWTENTEEFRDISGYEGSYQISTFWRVKSLSRTIYRNDGINSTIKGIILKQSYDKGGYLKVRLYIKGKQKSLNTSTLAASVFLNHKSDGTHNIVIDHKDNIKTHNWVWNLQLITQRKNTSKDRKNKTSKYTGVCWDKNKGKWLSQIYLNGKRKYLGRFVSEIDAHNAYQLALSKI